MKHNVNELIKLAYKFDEKLQIQKTAADPPVWKASKILDHTHGVLRQAIELARRPEYVRDPRTAMFAELLISIARNITDANALLATELAKQNSPGSAL